MKGIKAKTARERFYHAINLLRRRKGERSGGEQFRFTNSGKGYLTLINVNGGKGECLCFKE